jgi:transcriptional regulator with PAS, ATPase and Fis domain
MLPPLRQRTEDIPALSHWFLHRYSLESKKNFSEIAEEALQRLVAYSWPGNVRELANVIERAVVLGSGPKITLADLPGRIAVSERQMPPDNLSYRDAMEATRRDLVLKALAQSGGNRSAAAKALGLHEKYFLRLIKTLGIT